MNGTTVLPIPALDDRSIARFWARVRRTETCWLFETKNLNRSGHAFFCVRDEKYLAHRVSWTLEVGPLPDDECVLHHCDVPTCVRPSHLFLGDRRLNNLDRDQKGRHRALKGSTNGFAKLTEEQVRRIRQRRADGEPQHRIAKDFGVTQSLISLIDRGLAWSHVR